MEDSANLALSSASNTGYVLLKSVYEVPTPIEVSTLFPATSSNRYFFLNLRVISTTFKNAYPSLF